MKGSWKSLLRHWIESAFPLDADEYGALRRPAELRFGLPFGRPRRLEPDSPDPNPLDRAEREAWFPPPAA